MECKCRLIFKKVYTVLPHDDNLIWAKVRLDVYCDELYN